MTGCKDRKRVQLYLDGWMDEAEAGRFEAHLKLCPDCQAEMIGLEEVSSSALEIVDQAPESAYWDGFFNRLLNRIIARNVSPYETKKESSKSLRLRIGTYALAVTTAASVFLLIFIYAVRTPTVTDNPEVSDQPMVVADQLVQEAPVTGIYEGRVLDSGRTLTAVTADQERLPVLPADMTAETALDDATGTTVDAFPAGEGMQEPASRANVQFRDLFRDAFRQSPARLTLDGDSGFLDRLMSLYSGSGSDNYRLDQETVVEAVLSGYGPWIEAVGGERSQGVSVNGSIPGIAGRPYPELPETSEKDELARYLIELQIMRAK